MMHDRLFDGRAYRLLNVIDEFTRECLTIYVARSIQSSDVIRVLWEVMKATGRKPEYLRSDNGSEFTAKAVIDWLTSQRVGPAFIDPGSPWQNGFVESFNGKVRQELLQRAWFHSLVEAHVIVQRWRNFYNDERADKRPHSALGRMSPTQFAATQIMI